MKSEELIKKLKELPKGYSGKLNQVYKISNDEDCENGHKIADLLLLEYINNPEITEVFKKIGKWYA